MVTSEKSTGTRIVFMTLGSKPSGHEPDPVAEHSCPVPETACRTLEAKNCEFKQRPVNTEQRTVVPVLNFLRVPRRLEKWTISWSGRAGAGRHRLGRTPRGTDASPIIG